MGFQLDLFREHHVYHFLQPEEKDENFSDFDGTIDLISLDLYLSMLAAL